MAKGNNRRDLDDDAPWLAEASPRAETRVTRRSFFWMLAVLLTLAAVAAIGLVMLMSKKNGGSTQGYMEAEQAPLITAVPGPYKVPPIDPKGLQVEGQDQTIYAAGEGIDSGSVIDQSAQPEVPLPRPGSAPPPGLPQDLIPAIPTEIPPATTVIAPKPAAPKPLLPPVMQPQAPKTGTKPPAITPKPVAIAPAIPPKSAPAAAATPAKPAETPPKRAMTAQLGAFSSPEKADAAWAALAGTSGMAGFGKRVTPIERNGQTLYRLRASGGDAAALCSALKAAGKPCSVVE